MNPIKVSKIFKDVNKGKNRKFTYSDVKYDNDNWADASLYLPPDFDLVYIKTKNKIYSGWSVKNGWDGLKHKIDSKVLFWKRCQ